MPRLRFLSLALAVLLIACSSGATGSAGSSPISSPGAAAANRIEVKLLDALKIELATASVPVGVPVTFVVTNTGAMDHEFYLGDEAAQAAHAKTMTSGGMAHDEPAGIGLKPGETKELTYTFAAPGETIAGCHVAGHYGAGMKAVITAVA